MKTNYKTVFQLAQDKGMRFLKCKHCGNIELNCLKDNLCTSCFTYAETPTTQWANGVDTNLLILTLIQKWLRDEHKISVEVNSTLDSLIAGSPEYHFGASKWGRNRKYKGSGHHTSYESALLEGIRAALDLI